MKKLIAYIFQISKLVGEGFHGAKKTEDISFNQCIVSMDNFLS